MSRALRPIVAALLLAAAPSAAAQPAAPPGAELAAEKVGEVTPAPPPAPHQIWVADFVFKRIAWLDGDGGRFLGMLSTGTGAVAPVFSQAHGEIYLPETYYSRGSRGERSDVVTIYDVATLSPVAEVAIPPKRADVVHAMGLATLLDDDRFLALYNFTPGTSVTIVDVAERRFAGEIATPGCSLVYGAGPRRFLMLCGDGTLLQVTLDEGGAERSRTRSERLFDPVGDPVTEKAVRRGDEWLFVSFSGRVHPVDVAGDAPRFGEPWSLLDEAARAASWQIGGTQHLAVHEASGRLYSLVHRGGPDGHKDAGTEVWVYDLASRARVQTIALRNLLAAFLAQQIGVESDALLWLLERAVPDVGVDSIAVSQDAEPRLFGVSLQAGTVGVWDARSGAFLRYLENVGLAPGALRAPWR
ncbi:MAG TPA: amine dehydrogenase large subunit [Myxococcota bacterium]|nr:amine dehydrogenase large subunit [Myxococcota bacterium]